MNMYEDSFGPVQEGEVSPGSSPRSTRTMVLVDIATVGRPDSHQRIQGRRRTITAKVRSRVEVMVEWWDDEDERVILSKEKAATSKVWDNIKSATTRTAPSGAPSPPGQGWILRGYRSAGVLARLQADLASHSQLGTYGPAKPTTCKILNIQTGNAATSCFRGGSCWKKERESSARRPCPSMLTKARC